MAIHSAPSSNYYRGSVNSSYVYYSKGIVMKNMNCIKSCLIVLTLSAMGCATNGGGQNVTGSVDSGLSTVEQSAQSGRQIIQSGTTAAQGIGASQISLVDMLTRQLAISQQQALGGAGAIFQAAQGNMDPQEFSSLSQSVPGINDMLSAAPVIPDSISSMTGGVSSMMGGGTNNTLNSGASLAASFQQLNLSPDMVGQFIPIVTDYVSNSGGQAAANLLRSALSMP